MKRLLKILVVDDDAATLQYNALILKKSGYNVIKESSSANVQQTIKTNVPDAVLMDWHMPEPDGITVLKMLQEQELTKEIPVIITSGVNTSDINLREALELGAADFIKKPVEINEIHARIFNAIRLRQFYRDLKEKDRIIYEKELEISKRKILKYQTELEDKDKELAIKSTQLMSKTQLFENIMQEIKSTFNNDKQSTKQVMELFDKYKGETLQLYWNEFEIKFQEMYQQFYLNLSKAHPNLTRRDRNLCAFYRMNMSSKEIAALTMSEYSAIKKARTRLRKKLNIESDVQLTTYLQQF